MARRSEITLPISGGMLRISGKDRRTRLDPSAKARQAGPAMNCVRRLLLLGVLALAALSAAPASRAGEVKTHTVAEGHSLWKIARRYHVSVEALRAWNHLKEGEPLQPGQRLEIPPKEGRSPAGSTKNRSSKPERKADKKSGKDKNSWVTAKPAASTQVQKTPAQRGGVNPCLTKDPGFGIYDRWSRAPSMGQMIAPQRGGVTRKGSFDVMIHFHGHEAVRKEWVKVMNGPVLVGIDLGIGSGAYTSAFQSPRAFEVLIESVEAAVAGRAGRDHARARKIGLSAWSAGYGAVEQILRQKLGQRVDTVILLDGLHAGYAGTGLDDQQMEPFLDFARKAARGKRLMFVSHSSIIPPGYASTTETANFLIAALGGRPKRTRPRGSDPMGLDLISRYGRGNFHVRGFSGNDKMDHCAHIGLYKDVLKVHVKKRWRSPRGYRRKGAKPRR